MGREMGEGRGLRRVEGGREGGRGKSHHSGQTVSVFNVF